MRIYLLLLFFEFFYIYIYNSVTNRFEILTMKYLEKRINVAESQDYIYGMVF